MKQIMLISMAACVLALSACGRDCDCDDSGNKSSDPNSETSSTESQGSNCSHEQGNFVTNEELCKLTCGQTTRAEAIEVLGNPDSSINDALGYHYMCIMNATESNTLYISLSFDEETGTLESVYRTGLGEYAAGTLPECVSACKL
jgi:hypothetical protein